jgi:hypothetical protein
MTLSHPEGRGREPQGSGKVGFQQARRSLMGRRGSRL